MWPSYFIVYLLSHLLLTVVTNAADTNVFIFPPAVGILHEYGDDLVFSEGSVKHIRLRTTAPSFQIRMFQALLNESSTVSARGNVWGITDGAPCDGCGEEYTFRWKVSTYGTDLSLSPVYYFQMFPTNQTYIPFICHTFNITKSEASNPTATLTGSAVSSTTAATSTDSASTASSSDPSSADSTHSLKVGLGVGLGVGIPLVLVVGLFLGIRLGRKRRSGRSGVGLSTPHHGLAEKNGPSRSQQKPVFEVSGESIQYELSGLNEPTELGAGRGG